MNEFLCGIICLGFIAYSLIHSFLDGYRERERDWQFVKEVERIENLYKKS